MTTKEIYKNISEMIAVVKAGQYKGKTIEISGMDVWHNTSITLIDGNKRTPMTNVDSITIDVKVGEPTRVTLRLVDEKADTVWPKELKHDR